MQNIPRVILLIETSTSYGRGLLRGIARYSRLHGPWVFYSEPGGQRGLLPPLEKWGADGIIVRIVNERVIKRIIAMGLPTITTSNINPSPTFHGIIPDEVAVGKMGAEHLIGRGFRRFAYCGFRDADWSLGRREGFCKTIAKAGLRLLPYEEPHSRIWYEWEIRQQDIMVNWLKSLPKPVGLMVCNDEHGRRVLNACKIAGVHVPEEIAVLGVDNDIPVCDLSTPSLSSIVLDVENAGYKAAELLDKLMRSEKKLPTQVIRIEPTHVVTRQSTDVSAIEDYDVATAMNFIRRHFKEAIQVPNVVDATSVSRRTLEHKFQQITGRCIHDEIRHIRIEYIAQLLLETDMSVSQIVSALVYPSEGHIARFFRQGKGVSPLEFRKLYGRKS